MATLVLSAAGAALGGAVGGSALGLSSVVLGRAAGATLGRVIDQKLLGQGSQAVETGKVDRFRLTGASEGTPIPQLYGRLRLGGQVIWATQFQETTETSGGGGKIGPSKPKTTEYSYSISLAIAICDGVISHVGRVWADGEEVDPDTLNMRVYPGSMDQMPDPKIAAVQGMDSTPAFRGTAYVVMEDIELAPFGNRVPQFSFEVTRPAQDATLAEPEDMASAVQAVALMPGTGEYSLATEPVYYDDGFGTVSAANLNTLSSRTDLTKSLDALTAQLPRCGSTSLIVSWFGTDLRCGACVLEPRVEQTGLDPETMPWRVAGVTRDAAAIVPYDEGGRPIYGGTPTDQSVIQSIHALKDAGQEVMFYPFILMSQMAGNDLPNPYTGELGQPVLPWRGRITTSLAPGVAGTPDRSGAAETEVAAFMGVAQPEQFDIGDDTVSYTGPEDRGYRRFILHYAHLCALAGGVDAFCIGSEMRGLTQIRGSNDSFPAVAALKQLAAECKAILGPDCDVSYAADWSEYFGYQPPEGGGDIYYHLDSLWADPNVDFIGIDNYMRLSDWRDGHDHLDAEAGSIYNLDYLRSNVAGGEGFDWFYHSSQARDAQIRTPITDGAYGEPWVYRYKDIRNWWSNLHYDRVGGVRSGDQTDWVPQSKPIRFTELGCPAVDKGTNQPNKFLDPKSSESSAPHYSNGLRDPLIQLQYLRAIHGYWRDPANNPISELYGSEMIDMSRAHVWAWDARPFPAFPLLTDVWSDGENYYKGHWITGRATGRHLGDVVREICARSGVTDIDVSRLFGFVRGYVQTDVTDARAALQPLMLAYGFDAVERNGTLVFFNRDGRSNQVIDAQELVHRGGDGPVLQLERAAAAEVTGRVQVTFVDADADFETGAADAVFPDEETHTLTQSELPLALTRSEARVIAERWLAEAKLARDAAQFALPPSQAALGAGDVVAIAENGGQAHYRIDRLEDTETRLVEAVRVEPGVYERSADLEVATVVRRFVPPLPVFATFLDLPLFSSDATEHAPYLAVTADPWPGAAAILSSPTGADYQVLDTIEAAATVGEVLEDVEAGPCGLFDRGARVVVRLTQGALASIDEDALLAGANLAAIGDGNPDSWEVLQFRDADLIGEDTYALTLLLRGQGGTRVPPIWPAGSIFVLLNGIPRQLPLPAATRGVEQHFLIGPASRPSDDPSYQHRVEVFRGNGLRPYAPVHLQAVEQGSDVIVSWIRRTRIDGDIWDVPDVPLGEANEAYRVRVTQGLLILREETVGTPTWTYDAAMRSADGLSGSYIIRIAQLSEKYGAGSEASIAMG